MLKIPKAMLNVANPTTDTGTGGTYAATFSPAFAGFYNGLKVMFRAASTNITTAPTFQLNTLAAKTIVKGNNAPLVLGDIQTNQWVELVYDTTLGKWVLSTPATGIIHGGVTIESTAAGVPSNGTGVDGDIRYQY
jgi:hypothetical protein